MQYVERDGTEHFHTTEQFPHTLEKKMKLLNYFRSYMQENLIKAGASIPPREGDELIRLPFLRQWFRTSRAVVMHLTNGTLQINYFKDHVKLILCPYMGAVTLIDEQKSFRTFRLSSLAQYGCSSDLAQRLEYVYEKITFLLSSKSQAVRKWRQSLTQTPDSVTRCRRVWKLYMCTQPDLNLETIIRSTSIPGGGSYVPGLLESKFFLRLFSSLSILKKQKGLPFFFTSMI